MIRISECFFLIFAVLFSNSAVNCNRYRLILTNNGPVTTGSNVTINATVVDNNGNCFERLLIFKYEDDTFPRHISEKETKSCEAIFDMPFETIIKPSNYRYKIDVLEREHGIPVDIPIASKLGEINITEHLNGQFHVFQNNTNLSENDPQTIYVSSNSETIYKVELNSADLNYLNANADSITVYWFVDNVYQGNTSNYTFSTHFTQSDTQHEILGIVVASIGPSLQSLTYPTTPATTPYPYTTTTTPYPYTTTAPTPTPYPTTPAPTPYPTPPTPTPYPTTPAPTPYPTTPAPTPYPTPPTPTPYPTTPAPTPYPTPPTPYPTPPTTTLTPTTPAPTPTTTPYPYTTTTQPPTPPNTNTNIITSTDTHTTTSTKGTTTIITTTTTITTIITTTITAVAGDDSTASISKTPQTDVTCSSSIINAIYDLKCRGKRQIDSLLSSVIHLETNQKYGYFNCSVLVIN